MYSPIHRKKRKLMPAGKVDFILAVATTVLLIFWVVILIFLIQTVHDVTYCVDRDFGLHPFGETRGR
ncbi:hypothetical protein QIO80_gp3 [ssRNA phage Gerhypos.2_5]|uniref:Uncharacterized protein n=2 Tax=Leviviricetes TaxID=2842243 RepID=A0A8S5L467_9VIRU|nr:hypothetical protein QIO80_gp3 [ssRNA phage Gerhypos.2_5]QDH91268.1 MAG: hypothetical protein H2Bulk34269_000002 [Leviviridae sp.]DAD52167.1 TPA_asm: hypothetical protein [ssRNA phage Gerhypos.2_5]